MFALLFVLVFQYLAKRLAGKNISEMTYLVLGGTWNLNSVNRCADVVYWRGGGLFSASHLEGFYHFPTVTMWCYLCDVSDRSLMAKKADGIKESADSNATIEEEETRGQYGFT